MLQTAFCEWFEKCVYVAAVVPILFRVRLSAICEFVGNNAALPHAFVFFAGNRFALFFFFCSNFCRSCLLPIFVGFKRDVLSYLGFAEKFL